MKPRLFLLTGLFLISFPSLGNAQQTVLQQDVDNLFYAEGMVQTIGMDEYLSIKRGINLNYKSNFLQGYMETISGRKYGEKPALGTPARRAYDVGCEIGELAPQMVKGIETELFEEESDENEHIKHKRQYSNGFVDGMRGKGLFTLSMAKDMVNAKKESVKKNYYLPNKIAGERFLENNKTVSGVHVLPSGVQYKIIKEGTGRKPTALSKVLVHYSIQTIDGKDVDSSYKRFAPCEFEMEKVITGWRDAVMNMPVGSTWMIYIPQELAYGDCGAGENIKPYSVLIFKTELIDIVK